MVVMVGTLQMATKITEIRDIMRCDKHKLSKKRTNSKGSDNDMSI